MKGVEENKKEIKDNRKTPLNTKISVDQINYKDVPLSMVLSEDLDGYEYYRHEHL